MAHNIKNAFIALCILLSAPVHAETPSKKDKYLEDFSKHIYKNCDKMLNKCHGTKLTVLVKDLQPLVNEADAERYNYYQKESNDIFIESYHDRKTGNIEVFSSVIIKSENISTPFGIVVGMRKEELIKILGVPRISMANDDLIYSTEKLSADEKYGLGEVHFQIENGAIITIRWEPMNGC